MGAAMMEPDVRIETNKKGFCRKHFDMMTGGGGSRLPLALMLESHIAETEKEIFSGGTLFDGKGLKEEEKLKKLDASCYVCSRTEDAFSKMLGTVIYLWENEEEFRENTNGRPASVCLITSCFFQQEETACKEAVRRVFLRFARNNAEIYTLTRRRRQLVLQKV